MARAITAAATASTSSAAASTLTPRRAASGAIAACARSRDSGIAPPSRPVAGSRPSTTLASVTVGRVPPRSYAAGPGSAPADSGPTLSAPPASR